MVSPDPNAANGGIDKEASKPPGRYVCQMCGICVATSEYPYILLGVILLVVSEEGSSECFLGTKDDTFSFNELYGSFSVDSAQKTVACPSCEMALGTRGDGTFLLRRERIIQKMEKLEILVCSLKNQEIQELSTVLNDTFPHCNITPKVLTKSELRGFNFTAPKPTPELVVVVHRNEGRALLTDRNGFYHDVLGSAWQVTRGNVVVVLTRTELKADAELFDEKLLKNLSTQGDQPTIGAISALGRVLTWETSPNKTQSTHLKALMSKAYFREVQTPASNQGIPATWVRSVSKATTTWCTLI